MEGSTSDGWISFEYAGTKGERCDVAVTLHLRGRSEFAEVSRARVQALIEQGGVLVNGRDVPRVQKNMHPGMVVDINLPQLRSLLRPAAPEDITPLDIPLEFLHIDEHLAVVVKPAGLTVHAAPTETGPTLTAALLHHLQRLSDEGGTDRPGIVHRLDKETSGVLVVARDNPAHVALSRQFAERVVEKEYTALCIDAPDPPVGTVDSPIERHPQHRQRMWSGGHGRSALTEYRVAEAWGPFALVDVAIHTGRTHQIRVHLLTCGAGIVNDDKYSGGRMGSLRKFLRDGGDRSARRTWRQLLPDADRRHALLEVLAAYPGIFLHSQRLSFIHPATGERMEFRAKPPAVWEQVRELCSIDAGPQ